MSMQHVALRKALIASLTSLAIVTTTSSVFAQLPSVNASTIKDIVGELSSDWYEGRGVNTAQNRVARARLVEELEARGVTPAGTEGFLQPWEINGQVGANVIGVLYPYQEATSDLPTVLLSAHYDGPTQTSNLCFGSDLSPDSGISNICNGAADNMTGVGSILAILDLVVEQIDTPVAIAFWDGEEDNTTDNSLLSGHKGTDAERSASGSSEEANAGQSARTRS